EPRGRQDRCVAGARDLEKDLVLPFELDLLVVEATGQEHGPIDAQQVSLGELGSAAALGFRLGSHAEKILVSGITATGTGTNRVAAPTPHCRERSTTHITKPGFRAPVRPFPAWARPVCRSRLALPMRNVVSTRTDKSPMSL